MDNFIPLDSIQLATPCSADWNAMPGDSRTRFCAACEKNVYNLSDMTRAQAQALVTEKEGRMCAIFFRREDGTVLTDDCPIPLRPARNGALYVWRGAVAALLTILAIGGGWVTRSAGAAPETGSRMGKIAIKPTPTPTPVPVPGGIIAPPISIAPPGPSAPPAN